MDPDLTKLSRGWPKAGQIWPKLDLTSTTSTDTGAKCCSTLADVGEVWPNPGGNAASQRRLGRMREARGRSASVALVALAILLMGCPSCSSNARNLGSPAFRESPAQPRCPADMPCACQESVRFPAQALGSTRKCKFICKESSPGSLWHEAAPKKWSGIPGWRPHGHPDAEQRASWRHNPAHCLGAVLGSRHRLRRARRNLLELIVRVGRSVVALATARIVGARELPGGDQGLGVCNLWLCLGICSPQPAEAAEVLINNGPEVLRPS